MFAPAWDTHPVPADPQTLISYVHLKFKRLFWARIMTPKWASLEEKGLHSAGMHIMTALQTVV